MSQKISSKIIEQAIEKWGQEETKILMEFFKNIGNSIENINIYKFTPENEPETSSD